MTPIFYWLNWADSHHLTRLELFLQAVSMSPEKAHPIKRYLHSLSDSLEHLKLVSSRGPCRPSSFNSTGAFEDLFDLRHFTNLRTLHIDFQHMALAQSVVPIVQTLVSPVLERVTFVFDEYLHFVSVPWILLDPFFSDFPNLEAICVNGSARHSKIREWLPNLNARGLIDIKP